MLSFWSFDQGYASLGPVVNIIIFLLLFFFDNVYVIKNYTSN